MLFTTEVPIAAQRKVFGQFDFLIAPYMKKKGYGERHRNAKYGIMDNGAFEYTFGVLKGQPKMPKHPQYFNVIPDQYDATPFEQMAKLRTYGKGKAMYVPHALTKAAFLDLVADFLAYADRHPKHTLILGLAIREKWFGKNRFVAGWRRYQLAKQLDGIIRSHRLENHVGIHLLGSLSVWDLWLCRRLPSVLSADSSMPITTAIAGKKIGLFTRKYPQVHGFIDQPMTDEAMNLAQRNIDYIIKVLRYAS